MSDRIFSNMGENNGNADLVCEKPNFLSVVVLSVYVFYF